MLNTTKDQEEFYLEQVTKVWTCFKNFSTPEKRELFANFCHNITQIQDNSPTYVTAKQILDNKALLEYIGIDNIGYLLDFIKIITTVESVALKDKMMELIKVMS